MPTDRFQTPEHLARAMIEPVAINPRVVADFAVGHGTLLRAAASKWESARLFGTDVCLNSLRKAQKLVPEISVGRCNFLDHASRNRSSVLRSIQSSVDLVTLNPPFSCRGASTVSTHLFSENIRCSIGLAFLINALPYLKKGGEIVAVLPAATMYAEKDENAWQAITNLAALTVTGWNDRNTFQGCFPRTVLIHLKLRPRTPEQGDELHRKCHGNPVARQQAVQLYRGNLPMFQVPEKVRGLWVPFIHSTELRKSKVIVDARKIDAKTRVITAPAVLLPRVGFPNKSKVAVLTSGSVALSDCVFGLASRSKKSAALLRRLIVEQWPEFEALYCGTGARYLTASKLARWLRSKGYNVTPHPMTSSRVAKLLAKT